MNQLDWISETSEQKEERLLREVERLSQQCEKVRKGQYAKLTAMTKVCNELKFELEFLKAHICKNNLYLGS